VRGIRAELGDVRATLWPRRIEREGHLSGFDVLHASISGSKRFAPTDSRTPPFWPRASLGGMAHLKSAADPNWKAHGLCGPTTCRQNPPLSASPRAQPPA
jgi:hypothetical protein